jgi:hypothetical protein
LLVQKVGFMMRNTLVLILLAFLITGKIFSQNPQEKFALVIGVKAYQHVQPLQNSLNDAKDLSALLKKKGFKVIELYDPKTKREMQDAVRKYFGLLQGKDNVAGMVFYSGHGMQVDGVNYLIPSQANPQIKADLEDQCLSMDYVMQAIAEAGNGLNIFVLDACRNNPFRSFSRSAEKGLTMVNAPRGSYIVYATKPGSVASDGTGRNGLFTSKLLKHIDTDGLKFEEVFKRVAADVATESGDAQRPWISSDYTGDFFFSPGNGEAPREEPKTEPVRNEPVVTKKDEKKNSAPILGKDLNNNKAENNLNKKPDNTTSTNSTLPGVWQNTQFGAAITLYLNEDGTGEFNGELIRWSLKQAKFTMSNSTQTTVYNFKQQGEKITFSGGDLQQPLEFVKYSDGGSINEPDNNQTVQQSGVYGVDTNLVGTWSNISETVEFKSNGQAIYAGQAFPYQAVNGVVTMSTVQGAMSFYYSVNGRNLTLTINGLQYYYNKVK